MKNLTNILSTKTLSNDLLKKLDTCSFKTLSFDFISIQPIPFVKDEILNSSTHWIITSKNTIKLLLTNYKPNELQHINFYCVGDKTAKIIVDNNLKLVTIALSSAQLANKLVQNDAIKNYTFICGEMRRNELERILKNRKIQLNEYIIYSTTLSPNEIKQPLDGILFFSPSAIQSYLLKNSITTETLFCIGNTTATEAKKYSTNIIIADSQTIESVVESVKKHYT